MTRVGASMGAHGELAGEGKEGEGGRGEGARLAMLEVGGAMWVAALGRAAGHLLPARAWLFVAVSACS
jgi:hypothetical protein